MFGADELDTESYENKWPIGIILAKQSRSEFGVWAHG